LTDSIAGGRRPPGLQWTKRGDWFATILQITVRSSVGSLTNGWNSGPYGRSTSIARRKASGSAVATVVVVADVAVMGWLLVVRAATREDSTASALSVSGDSRGVVLGEEAAGGGEGGRGILAAEVELSCSRPSAFSVTSLFWLGWLSFEDMVMALFKDNGGCLLLSGWYCI
jgi:hypothetical protein